MTVNVPIFLLGYMTSGKSSLGKKLAKQLHLKFIDLDCEIEEKEGLSISEIFQEKGETYFRNVEAQALRNIQASDKAVIALGGGTPCYHNNMEYIKKTGMSIFLDMSEETLIGRLRKKKSKRPMVAQLNDTELKAFVHQQLEERRVFYQQANIQIPSNEKPAISVLLKALSLTENN